MTGRATTRWLELQPAGVITNMPGNTGFMPTFFSCSKKTG